MSGSWPEQEKGEKNKLDLKNPVPFAAASEKRNKMEDIAGLPVPSTPTGFQKRKRR